MASGQTANFGLNQWAAEDKVIRTEFNEDNAKIDAVLAEIPTIVTGSYVGDGSASRFINLGFTPKAVYICHESGTVFSSAGWSYWGGLALLGKPAKRESYNIVSIATNGFQVYYRTDPYTVYSNLANNVFYYVVLR